MNERSILAQQRVQSAVFSWLEGRTERVDGFYHLIRRQIEFEGKRTALRDSEVLLGGVVCLETFEAAGGIGSGADNAASAVTLLLTWLRVHDDIQRETHDSALWPICGIPQAINAGDGMFPLAVGAMLAAGRSEGDSLALARELSEVVIAAIVARHRLLADGAPLVPQAFCQIVEQSTGMPTGLGAWAGAGIAGADESARAQLRDFGCALGTAARLHRELDSLPGSEVQVQLYVKRARAALVAARIRQEGRRRLDDLVTEVVGR